MCFLIAGIQPRTRDMDGHPRMCHSCGLYQAYVRRTDHYLSLFFLPLIPVRKGTPFVECRKCGAVAAESGEPRFTPPPLCAYCGRAVEKDFRFCPACGKAVR